MIGPRTKFVILALLSLGGAIVGFIAEANVPMFIGIFFFGIFGYLSVSRNDIPKHQQNNPSKKEKSKEKPINEAEFNRGKKELIELVQSFIDEGHGEHDIHLDLGERQKPTEVLYEVQRQSDLGNAFLELYIHKNRKNWREHYTDEEWSFAKAKILEELGKCSPEKMDEIIVHFGTESFTPNQLIQAVKVEDRIGTLHILGSASMEFD